MQTYPELTSSLGCSDCKSNFNSASALLQHFAQHVSQEASKHGSIQPSTGTSIPYLQKKKKKAETILERVLKRNSALRHMTPTSLNEPGPSTRNGTTTTRTASSSSHLSSFQVTNLEPQNKCEDYITLQQPCDLEVMEKNNFPEFQLSVDGHSVIEEGSVTLNLASSPHPSPSSSSVSSFSSDITLIKCDFQKRLENCITKLVSKRGSGSALMSSDVGMDINKTNLNKELFNITTSSKKPKIASKNGLLVKNYEIEENRETKEVIADSDSNDFFVVKERGDKSHLHSVVRPEDLQIKEPRTASSRKQKTPKKINYLQVAKLENAAVESYCEPSDLSMSFTTPKKKYPCHLCSRVFGWSTDLKRHILTHTGERPFRCNVCDATFTRNFLLQKHQSKTHSLCFTMLKESTMSNLHSPKKEDPLNSVLGEDMGQEIMGKCIDTDVVRCSYDISTERCNKKESGSVPIILGYTKPNNSHHKKMDTINSLRKGKDFRCNKISYEIFSHEALNIL